MHNMQPGINQISTERLSEIVGQLIDQVPDALRDFSTAGEEAHLPFGERIANRTRRIETVLTDVRTCGVLVEDVSRPGHFKFAHKVFYEYLVGVYVAYRTLAIGSPQKLKRNLNKDGFDVIIQALIPALGISRLMGSSSHEITQFAGQLFARRFAETVGEMPTDRMAYALLKELDNGLLRVVLMSMRFVSPGRFIERAIFTYFIPIVRMNSWRVKMWYHGCISQAVDRECLRKIVGIRGERVLAGEWSITEINDRIMAFALDNRPSRGSSGRSPTRHARLAAG